MMQLNFGVGILVLNKQKQILLGKRKNNFRAGYYGLPGGKVDGDESLLTCCQRELVEETNLTGQSFTFLGVVREQQKTEDGIFIHFAYLCNDFQGNMKNMEPNKCESWAWYSLDKLPTTILPGQMEAIDMFLHPETPRIRDITS